MKDRIRTFLSRLTGRSTTCAAARPPSGATRTPRRVVVVPVTHGTVSGWLVDFDLERNYVVSNHLSHIDRLDSEPRYAFAVSEVPNLMALRRLARERFQRLIEHVHRGRAELVNAFFLEPSINLPSGETLLRMGLDGIAWQKAFCGVTPRWAWMIDVVGVHPQMPEILHQLGIETLVYGRNCATTSMVHWWESAAGSRVLGVCCGPTCYVNWRLLFTATDPLTDLEIRHLQRRLREYLQHIPATIPALWLVAVGDYGVAPARIGQVEHLVEEWSKHATDIDLEFAVPDRFLDRLAATEAAAELPVARSDTLFSHNAFWANNPRMKQAFRRAEAELMAVEAACSLLEAAGRLEEYPSQLLSEAWAALYMNADRGLIWGIGDGSAFESATAWCAADRFELIADRLQRAGARAGVAISSREIPQQSTLLAPVASAGCGPYLIDLPDGSDLDGIETQASLGGRTIARLPFDGLSTVDGRLTMEATAPASITDLPESIRTAFYEAKICSRTGDLESLLLRGSKPIELLSGGGNAVWLERQPNLALKEDFLLPRAERELAAKTSASVAELRASRGPLAIEVECRTTLPGETVIVRRLCFYHDHPRIDAEVELIDVPDGVLVSINFPLASAIRREARGIPYGFSERTLADMPVPAPEQLYDDHRRLGVNTATTPALRWSSYELVSGGGLSILDQGIPGRETHPRTATVLLMNASERFRDKPNHWLSGRGRHVFRYAIVPHRDSWREAEIPAMAQAFGAPLLILQRGGLPRPIVQVSRNVLLESSRRIGRWLELRLVEAYGRAGDAEIVIGFAHSSAVIGTARDRERRTLRGLEKQGTTTYRLALKPQEIATLSFDLGREAPAARLIEDWDELVPPAKRSGLDRRDPNLIGHPPER